MYRHGWSGEQSGVRLWCGPAEYPDLRANGSHHGGRHGASAGARPATIIARRKFDKAQQEGGKAALVLGLCFITEGAIPFAARDPMRVLPCCIAGGAVTGAISMAIGAKLMAPHGGLFVLLIPGAITPVLGYLLAIVAGTLVAGLSYAVLKRPEAEVVAKAA